MKMPLMQVVLQKSFFSLLVRDIQKQQLFYYNDKTHTFWFNHNNNENINKFYYIGVMLGLAIYNGITVNLRFPTFVFRKLMGFKSTLDDLTEVTPEIGKGLKQLLEHQGDVSEDFGLNFQIAYSVLGEVKVHNLVEMADCIPVTNQNRQEYVDLYVKYLLEEVIHDQFEQFSAGFCIVCDSDLLYRIFIPEEMHDLICGIDEFDIKQLQKVTKYEAGYTSQSQPVKFFWEILQELPLDKQKKFLFFVSGSDRVPIGGLSSMKMIISRCHASCLPTSHTCFNNLVLPACNDKKVMLEKLLIALENCEGFGFL